MVNFFIHRPVFASVIAIIMVLTGLIAYSLLPVAQFPEITPPQVVVTATYPGASAQVVANTVTTPLEQQINGVPGMAYMSSVSANDGSSTITITFNVGYPIDIAAVDVQNRVSQAAAQLPAIVNQAGVTITRKTPTSCWASTSTSPDGSVDLVTLSNYAYLQLVDPLKRLPGVGDVSIFGERRYSMRIWLDPDKLAKLGITAIDVQTAIAEQNIQVAAGKLGQSPAPPGTAFEFQVNAVGRLSDPQQFGNIVVRAGTDERSRRAPARRRPHRAWRPAVHVERANERAARRYSSPSTRRPDPTHCRSIERSATEMAELGEALSQGDRLGDQLRHDDVRLRVDARRGDHAGRGAGAGHRRRVPVPAELAQHGHPRHRHPGLADRDAGGDAGARLLAQHGEHARHGAGDRTGGRRCDRRGRERGATARAGLVAGRRPRLPRCGRSPARSSPRRPC